MRKVLQWFIVAALVAASIFLAFSNRREYDRGYKDALASIKPDTEYVEKEIYTDKPVPVTEYKDTGRVVEILIHDTTYVYLPREVRQFADPNKEIYELQVSGIDPTLDWIKVKQKTAYINVPVPEYKYPTFALSPAISANLFPGSFGIGGGLDVDYWYKRWQFSAEGGYAVNFTNTMNTGFYAKGTVKYNLILR